MIHPFRAVVMRQVLRAASVVICLASGSALGAQAINNADTISLIRKFSGLRFQAGSTEAKVHAGMAGLSPAFESVVGKHPEALRAARKTRPYSIMQLAGTLGVAVAGALALKQSLDDADDPLNSGGGTTPLIVMAGSGAVAVAGIVGGRHYLNQSIRLFNDAQRSAPNRGAAALFRATRVGIGVSADGGVRRANIGLIVPMRRGTIPYGT